MKRLAGKWPVLPMAVTIAVGIGAWANACNVPVFRFALERWRPDPYRVVLFHRGELTEDERELIRTLETQQDQALANLAVQTVDLADGSAASEEDAADRALYDAIGKPELPWLVIQYPAHLRIPKPVWAGPLRREIVEALADSPIRRELARRLAEGQTAVWLLLESGQPEKDNAAVALLEEQLKKLEAELELPELTTAPEDAITAALPLKIAFSVLRVPREVAAEHALVAMLIGSEPDLAERSDPIVFPVFGRGRALLPLMGAGITEKNIHDVAEFLAGPCSCEVKEQNPGFDLLLGTDWDALLSQGGVSLTAIETSSSPPAGEPELVPIPAGSNNYEATPDYGSLRDDQRSALAPEPLDAAQYRPVFVVAIGLAGVVGIVLLIAISMAIARPR